MEKVEERERQILAQLKELNIDPTAPTEEQKPVLPSLPIDVGDKNTDYVSIMAQIEAKEKELEERE